MAKMALSEYRDVELYLTTAGSVGASAVAAPIDAYKAAVGLIEELEGSYAKLGASGVPDLAAVSVIRTGTLPFQIHVFTVTSTMATGVYLMVYVETVPTVADIS